MNKIDGKKLSKQAFVLEETYFVNCVLRECDLFYSGGDCQWVNTTFENCYFHWLGAAKNTRKLLGVLGMLKEDKKPQTVLKTSTEKLQ